MGTTNTERRHVMRSKRGMIEGQLQYHSRQSDSIVPSLIRWWWSMLLYSYDFLPLRWTLGGDIRNRLHEILPEGIGKLIWRITLSKYTL